MGETPEKATLPADVETRRRSVIATAPALRQANPATRAAWLSEAARQLGNTCADAAPDLAGSTGLSAPMVEWASRTTLDTVDAATLERLHAEAYAHAGSPVPWLPLVLAGNLFTAAVRGVFVPLLLGAPVFAKASSKDSLFPCLLRDALRAVDPVLGSAFDVVTFTGGDVVLERSLVGAAEIISVYGSDETVAEVRERHPNAHVLPHGHGVSVGYCNSTSLGDVEALRAVALDVCAYDQRGCLSPQAIYVEATRDEAERYAKRLAVALAETARELPRGPLPLDVGAAQTQWRGLAEVEGCLFAGDAWAVAVVDRNSVRWSPGYRNVTVVPVEDLSTAVDAWTPLDSALKCVGVHPSCYTSVSAALSESKSLEAYACALGTMQTPSFDVIADGKPPWHGLIR